MKKIILASSNSSKLREIQTILSYLPIQLIPQSEFNVGDIDETGLSFVENAILKARYAAQITHLPAIADDSGLVVAALNGEPGIYSARYANSKSKIENPNLANITKLLSKMEDIPKKNRQAYFYCAIVLIRHATDPTPLICQGRWNGEILLRPQGEKGFGYDPIFYVPTHHCSAAELPTDQKNKISHRGQALTELAQVIKQHLNE